MSEYSIHAQIDQAFDGEVDEEALRRAARLLLRIAQAPAPAALSVVITDAQTIQSLNAQHRGVDEPTDVLAFPADQDPTTREPGEPPYLGDVLIALPVAEQQAAEAGHATQDELNLLAIHGALHLLGYDHTTPDEQAEMWALQSAALDALREVQL